MMLTKAQWDWMLGASYTELVIRRELAQPESDFFDSPAGIQMYDNYIEYAKTNATLKERAYVDQLINNIRNIT